MAKTLATSIGSETLPTITGRCHCFKIEPFNATVYRSGRAR
jgi:hypothetical protein